MNQLFELHRTLWFGLAASLALVLNSSLLNAQEVAENPQELTRAETDLFEIHVRPTLLKHCISCHGETKQEGGLRLTSLEALVEGGDSGPAVVPGSPDESLIMEALRYESFEMPPEGPLEDQAIEGLQTWIAAGAPWPAEVVLTANRVLSEEDHQWWCYQPIVDPDVPDIDPAADWCRSDLDRFILAKLQKQEIEPAAEAQPLTLARRASFGLTGLPPSAAMIDAALSTNFDGDAWVDRLLESEHYGANQARFWLDLVRYADSDGYRADHPRPHASKYRDYVIRSFNEDKPYDHFIRQQLAGDELEPGNQQALVATMYLRHWIYEHNQRDVETQWHEILSDITETTSDVFLAQGLECARCHDHKFDPLLQKDFFRIKSFFAPFQPAEAHPIADLETRSAYEKQLAKWESATLSIRQQLRQLEHPILLEHATREGFNKFIPEIKQMIRKWPDDRKPYEDQIASLAARQYDLPYDEIEKWLSDSQKEERQRLLDELASFDHLKPEPLPTLAFVGSDIGPVAPPTYIPDSPDQQPVEPGYLTIIAPGEANIVPPPKALQSTGRRTALADWIASSDNPLTARVIVNRIWQQHFGRGLVETTSDFGRLGTPPSHPELLDWLACRFIEDGWSIKKLHRRIITSATYRQTSLRAADERLKRIDPENRWLWRFNPRRLTGEEIHDAVLLATGKSATNERAIFRPVRRNTPDPLLFAFDGPDRIRSVGRRHRTTTSTQALLLNNSDWAHEQATAIASRLSSGQDESLDAWIERLYRNLYGRPPEAGEVAMTKSFLQQYADQTPVEPPREVKVVREMPATKTQAVDLGGDAEVAIRFMPNEDAFREPDFTIEGTVLLRSLYENASVRTIAARWNGSKSQPGWSLGVTSTKSAYKPRNLILQLIGYTADGKVLHYEVIASDLHIELNKPYYVAASIRVSDPNETGIQFAIKDLSNPKAKLQTVQKTHTVVRGIHGPAPLHVGGRDGSHQWDGLIDRLALQVGSRDLRQTPQADSEAGLPVSIVDWTFEDRQQIGLDESGNGHHASVDLQTEPVPTPMERARVALTHALLNSNEMIYVD